MATLSTASASVKLSSLASSRVDDSGPAAAAVTHGTDDDDTAGTSASELGKQAAGGEC